MMVNTKKQQIKTAKETNLKGHIYLREVRNSWIEEQFEEPQHLTHRCILWFEKKANLGFLLAFRIHFYPTSDLDASNV